MKNTNKRKTLKSTKRSLQKRILDESIKDYEINDTGCHDCPNGANNCHCEAMDKYYRSSGAYDE